MRILIVNTDYPDFLAWHYRKNPSLAVSSYDEQMRARNESLFGAADSYSRNLQALGCEAVDVYANNESMQKRWALENGLDFGPPPSIPKARKQSVIKSSPLRLARRVIGFAARLAGLPHGRRKRRALPGWLLPILKAQIESFGPDVILNKDTYMIPSAFLAEAKGNARCVVAQIAAPIPMNIDWKGYDLVLSSIPHFVDGFRALGLDAEFLALGFDPVILDAIPAQKRDIPLLFVGSFSQAHQGRIEWIEYLARRFPMEIWGNGLNALSPRSPVREHFRGAAFGKEMYGLMRRARIALNHHIDIAGDCANNCRLYEAAGMGAMLLTDWKKNLSGIFEPGRETAAYRDKEECALLIEHYLRRDDERSVIAAAGQNRTLNDHTYAKRMAELRHILEQRL